VTRALESIAAELARTLKRETASIIKAGELLLEAKEQLAHGEWLPWLKQHCGFSLSTAERYT
jgi:hypothetical protein